MDISAALAHVRANLPSLWHENDAWTAERMHGTSPQVVRFRREVTLGDATVRVMLETLSGRSTVDPHTHDAPIAMEVIDGDLGVDFGREEGASIRLMETRQISRDSGMPGLEHADASSYALRTRDAAHGLRVRSAAVRVLTVVGPAWDDTAPPLPSDATPLTGSAASMERTVWSSILTDIGYLS